MSSTRVATSNQMMSVSRRCFTAMIGADGNSVCKESNLARRRWWSNALTTSSSNIPLCVQGLYYLVRIGSGCGREQTTVLLNRHRGDHLDENVAIQH
jgi:hypothetical protein